MTSIRAARRREQEILDEIAEAGPATTAEVARNTGLPLSTVRRYLHKLENTGRIESDDYHRRDRVWMLP
jgi:DNA-binding IclR family transcriptional regulator